jgi:hypothetical protein
MPQTASRRPPQFAFTFLALCREVIQINENKAYNSRTSAGHVEFAVVTVVQYCLWLQSINRLKVINLTYSESIKSNALELLSSSIMFHSSRFPPGRLVFSCLFDLNLPRDRCCNPSYRLRKRGARGKVLPYASRRHRERVDV